MLRIILIIALILIAIPFFNKTKDYVTEKVHKAETISRTVEKVFRYKKNGEK